jgi:hypothetical protein
MGGGSAQARRCVRALCSVAVGMACRGFAASAAADVVTSGAPAGPQPPRRPVHIERTACRAAPITDVVAVLRVELGMQLVEWPPQENAYQVVIDCSDDVVVISVAIPDRGTRSYRTNLAGAPATVRPRIVALAIAEIVRDLERESVQTSRTESVRAAAPAPLTALEPGAQASPQPALVDRPVQLGVFLQTSSFRLDGRWLVGGGVRFDYVRGWLCAGLEAAVLTADERLELGRVQTLLSYGGPYVGWQAVAGRWQARFGGGYALGVGKVAGHADSGFFAGTVTGPFAAPYAFGSVALALTSSIRVDAGARAGWVTLPVVGVVTRGTNVDLEGFWTGMQIGASLAL